MVAGASVTTVVVTAAVVVVVSATVVVVVGVAVVGGGGEAHRRLGRRPGADRGRHDELLRARLEEDPTGDRAGRRVAVRVPVPPTRTTATPRCRPTTSPVKGEPSSLRRVTLSEVVSVTLEPLVLMT